jgi:hypothetical protein
MMVLRVIPILSPLKEAAEFDGLIGLVVVHGPQIEAGDAKNKGADYSAEE